MEFSDSEDPEADSLYDQNEYTSFTVSGTEKPEKKFCIAFVGEGNLTKKGYSALFENVGKNLQEDLKARQQLIWRHSNHLHSHIQRWLTEIR